MAFLSIFLSSLVILSAYAASLISFLTVSTVSLPFSSLEGFARHGSYKLIAFQNSADYDRIVVSSALQLCQTNCGVNYKVNILLD